MIDSEVAFWTKEIETYQRDFGTWMSRSKKIVDRYRNDEQTKKNRFNVLYSNVSTLAPALYSQQPKPNFERRFSGDDSVGRVASLVLERAVSYYIDNDEFDDCLQQTVLDRLLCGRGTAWCRYEPTFDGALSDDEPVPNLKYEDVRIDYVHWEDFGHTFARTWQEVRAVWRIVYMSRKQMAERFGAEVAERVPFGSEKMSEEGREYSNKACVYEIWDKQTKAVYWIVKGFDELLDKKADPLGLKGFFPCPRPIFSQVANNNLVPVPDYLQYQDQAYELDMLTTRIDIIVKAIKVAGIYDASADGIKRLLSESAENKMIPVENWAMYKEGGGLKSAVSFFPLGEVMSTLQQLYQSRESVKQTIYEITGISDIIRGSSVASETATAQNIKSQYATMRLGKSQKDVQRFCRDIIRIMAELVAEHFSLETIKQISGITLLTTQEKMQYQMMAQQGQPLPPDLERMMKEPAWEEVYGVLQDDMARCFRIDIETDSTIKADQDAEKAARTEFLTGVSQFIVQAANVQDPTMKPLLLQLLRFGVQGFRVGKTMEAEFNVVIDKARQEALNPPPAQDPMAEKNAELQADQAKLQMEVQADMQKEQMRIDADMRIEQAKIDSQERMKQMELQTHKEVAGEKENHTTSREVMKARSTMTPEALAVEDGQIAQGLATMGEGIAQMAQSVNMIGQMMASVSSGQAAVIDKLNEPKVVEIKDATGKVVRTGTVQ